MAGADLARIHRVIVEILARKRPGLVSDQPVFGDLGRVEFDLHLYVIRDGEKRPGQLVNQHFLRLGQGVDIGRLAVAVLGQRLHGRVVQIAATKAQHAEVNATVALVGDEIRQRLGVGNPDIEIAIGGQDDARDLASAGHAFSHLIGLLQPGLPGG